MVSSKTLVVVFHSKALHGKQTTNGKQGAFQCGVSVALEV